MNRSDLAKKMASQFSHLPKKTSDQAVALLLDALAGQLGRGGRIEIRGFGAFDVTFRRSRVARNPKNGQVVMVQPKAVPTFKAGRDLRERVDAREDDGALSVRKLTSAA